MSLPSPTQAALSQVLPDLVNLLTGQPTTIDLPQETVPIGNTGFQISGSGSLTLQLTHVSETAPAEVNPTLKPEPPSAASQTGHGV